MPGLPPQRLRCESLSSHPVDISSTSEQGSLDSFPLDTERKSRLAVASGPDDAQRTASPNLRYAPLSPWQSPFSLRNAHSSSPVASHERRLPFHASPRVAFDSLQSPGPRHANQGAEGEAGELGTKGSVQHAQYNTSDPDSLEPTAFSRKAVTQPRREPHMLNNTGTQVQQHRRLVCHGRTGMLASSAFCRPHASGALPNEVQASGCSKQATLQNTLHDAEESPPFHSNRSDARAQEHIVQTSHRPMPSNGMFPLGPGTGLTSDVQVTSRVQEGYPSPCREPHGSMLADLEGCQSSGASLSRCLSYHSIMSGYELDTDSVTIVGDRDVELPEASSSGLESCSQDNLQTRSQLVHSSGHERHSGTEDGECLLRNPAQEDGPSPIIPGNADVQENSELPFASRQCAQLKGWPSWNRHDVREPGEAPLRDPKLSGETSLQARLEGELLPMDSPARADGRVHGAALEWAEHEDALVVTDGLANGLGGKGISADPSALQQCQGHGETETTSPEAAEVRRIPPTTPAMLPPFRQEGSVSNASVNGRVEAGLPVLLASSSNDAGDSCTGGMETSESLPEKPAGSAGSNGGAGCSALQRLAQRRMQQRLTSSLSRPASPASIQEGSLSVSLDATSMQTAKAGSRGREEWAGRSLAGSHSTSPGAISGAHQRRQCARSRP